ncbi:MAG: AMP-binding protein [Quinella sp. 1Q5]|nr:AMP-binding protein [Quinella sp. 1Q5]
MNFYDLLKTQAYLLPDKIFLRVDETYLTYKAFLNAVDNQSSGGNFISQAAEFFAAQKVNPFKSFEVKTSGSTSTPKTLRRSFDSWLNFFPTQNKVFRVDESSKVFMHGSLDFTGNLNTFLSVMHAGGSVITSDKFSHRQWLKLIKDATNIYLVPAKLSLLALGEPLNNIRSIFTGSQVLTEAQSLNLMKKFPAAEIFLYYGASELSFITYKKISAANAADVHNLGKPFDGVTVLIRDGLIYVDTPFRAEGITTPATVGDFGRIEGGDLIFEGRGEDFINRGGVKLSALDLERKIATLEGVKAVAVVKVPDKIRGDNFLAYVVGSVDKKIIRQALTPAESPKDIIFVDALPLNASGKVDKRKLLKSPTSSAKILPPLD